MMRSLVIVIAAAALTSLSGPVSAAPTGTEQKAKPAASEKKECRRLQTTGTRMTERVCLTKNEWKKLDRGDN